VKNSAPVAHNFFWDSGNNKAHNVTVPKMEKWELPDPLAKESAPIQYKCTIHGWMTGYVRIFDTRTTRSLTRTRQFVIKNAPVQVPDRVLARERIRGGEGPAGEAIRDRRAVHRGEATRVRRQPEVSRSVSVLPRGVVYPARVAQDLA
jgi:hypothetical protein